MTRPSMLIIPRASATPNFYDSLVRAIECVGLEIQALHIPSVGRADNSNRLPTNMYRDVTFIQEYITRLSDASKDILIITHLYGGTPGT